MKKILILVFILANAFAFSQNVRNDLFSSAFFEQKGYDVLKRICYEAGDRTPGADGNWKALDILQEELEAEGLTVKREPFTMPGWKRGNDIVKITAPVERELRVAALGYVDKHAGFSADVIFLNTGKDEDFETYDVQDKIILLNSGKTSRAAVILKAAEKGAKACLFMNNKPGMLIAGVSNFFGDASALPAYTITPEEGEWIKGLLELGNPVEIYIETNSHIIPNLKSENIAVTIPGKTDKRIVVGGHFDGWDLGNGAVDNGYGIAVLFDIARLLNKYAPNNEYTVDVVWFNAEEWGLWGSKAYAEAHKDEDIIAMFNFDMPGKPLGWNVMGYEEFMPFFEEMNDSFGAYEFDRGVVNTPWTNSDHIFFMMQGIPSFTMMGHLDKDEVYYYHDFGDTFDKVNKKHLAEAAAVTSVVIYEMANRTDLPFNNMDLEASKKFFIDNELDEQLKRQGWWYEEN